MPVSLRIASRETSAEDRGSAPPPGLDLVTHHGHGRHFLSNVLTVEVRFESILRRCHHCSLKGESGWAGAMVVADAARRHHHPGPRLTQRIPLFSHAFRASRHSSQLINPSALMHSTAFIWRHWMSVMNWVRASSDAELKH